MIEGFPRTVHELLVIPGSQPIDMAFRGDELFVACQGDASVHVIDIPKRSVKLSFQAGTGCVSLGCS